MKKILTLALVVLGATSLNAQVISTFNPYERTKKVKESSFQKHIKHMLSLQQGKVAQKTTVLKERVIAQSMYEVFTTPPVPNIFDTTRYSYTGFNGSAFDFNYMEFRSYFDLGFEGTYYPYDWSVLPVMADSVWFWDKDSATGPFNFYEIRTSAFDTGKRLTSFGSYSNVMGTPIPSVFIYNQYDALGKLVTLTVLSDGGSGLDSSVRFLKYYDTQGRHTHDSIKYYTGGMWVTTGLVTYTYDAGGNIITISEDDVTSSVLTPVSKYENTFYSSNKLQTSTSYHYNGTALEPSQKDSFAYDNNSTFVTAHTQFGYNNGIWDPQYLTSKHLNTQGLPDTVFQATYDNSASTWNITNKDNYSYTSYNNPLQSNSYFFNGLTWDLGVTGYFYYDVYNDPTGVKDTQVQEDIALYPNPTTSEINISWVNGTGRKVIFEFINALGQKALDARFTMKKDNASVSIQHLTPGTYWLIVRDEVGNVIFRQAVVKQ